MANSRQPRNKQLRKSKDIFVEKQKEFENSDYWFQQDGGSITCCFITINILF